MLILVDKRAPGVARKNLRKFGEVVEFSTEGLVYNAISGHPDIFITQFPGINIIAPNLPDEYKIQLKNHNIHLVGGDRPVGDKYPETAGYNAVATSKYFIHNLKISDKRVLEAAAAKTMVHVRQGYARCNLLWLNDEKMLTSDKGISATLINLGVDVCFVDPDKIILPGFKNGFIGGAGGVYRNVVYLLGSLKHLTDGKNIGVFVRKSGFEIIELYDGPLFDGGGIFFLGG